MSICKLSSQPVISLPTCPFQSTGRTNFLVTGAWQRNGACLIHSYCIKNGIHLTSSANNALQLSNTCEASGTERLMEPYLLLHWHGHPKHLPARPRGLSGIHIYSHLLKSACERQTIYKLPKCSQASWKIIVHRLSTVAQQQFPALCAIRQEKSLGEDADTRKAVGGTSILKMKQIYQALKGPRQPCANQTFIWKNRAPPKVQFFAWLLSKERLPTKLNLFKKNVVQSATCVLCAGANETAPHFCIQCPFVVALELAGDPTKHQLNARITQSAQTKSDSSQTFPGFLPIVLLGAMEPPPRCRLPEPNSLYSQASL